jgi:3-deoxy-D-manno-octulosonic-acid transferase
MEEVKSRGAAVALTFFSASGYEARKNYPSADIVAYLPDDSPSNARAFVELLRPDVAVFVKYEHWYYYLSELNRRKIPTFNVSLNVPESHVSLRFPYKIFFRRIYKLYTHIFVQTQTSFQYLRTKLGVQSMTVTGDTRIDRVWAGAKENVSLPEIEGFIAGRLCFVAGSTWPKDEKLIQKAIANLYNENVCWIVVPHEIHPRRIAAWKKKYGTDLALWSELKAGDVPKKILIVDTVGLLSKIYRYSSLVYVGGGFDGGVHNVLEPAVYGARIFFGPKHERFQECVDLLQYGAGYGVNTEKLIVHEVRQTLLSSDRQDKAREISLRYVEIRRGATEKIIKHWIQKGLI